MLGMERSGTMKAIGYVRVSTGKQAEHGLSLEAQEARIRAMGLVRDVEIVEVVVDAGESAGTIVRPGLQRVLGMVDRREVDEVIVLKLDRLTRSVRDLADLLDRFEESGIALVSVCESLDTKSAAGRLVLNVMAAVSQWEREATGERTREVLRHKRSKGEVYGQVPYGFKLGADGKTLEENEQEQLLLGDVAALVEGGLKSGVIAEHLNAQGYRTRTGGLWRPQYVSRLRKAAEREVGREVVRG